MWSKGWDYNFPPMPKGLRRIYGGGDFHFITCSCYRRQAWLKSSRRRNIFLEILEQVRKKYRFILAGYVVMPEHFHLLMSEPRTGTPSTVMQVLKQRVARRLLPKPRKRDPRQLELLPRGSLFQVLADSFLRFQCVHAEEAC